MMITSILLKSLLLLSFLSKISAFSSYSLTDRIQCHIFNNFAPISSKRKSTITMMHRHRLYDLPVSNNGARCRIIIYKKKIENEVEIESPKVLGGLKSPLYLALNPQGKMPLLIRNIDGDFPSPLPEADTICRFLLDNYQERGPSFLPTDAASNLISRLHDVYLCPIQGALYKAEPPFSM